MAKPKTITIEFLDHGDPELNAITACLKILKELKPSVQVRVLRYVRFKCWDEWPE